MDASTVWIFGRNVASQWVFHSSCAGKSRVIRSVQLVLMLPKQRCFLVQYVYTTMHYSQLTGALSHPLSTLACDVVIACSGVLLSAFTVLEITVEDTFTAFHRASCAPR